MDSILSLCILAAGIYILHAGIKLKKTGQTTGCLMFSPKFEDKNLCDREGFCRYLWPKVRLLGVMSSVTGAWIFVLYAASRLFGAMFVLVNEVTFLAAYMVVWIYYIHCVNVAGMRYCR